MPGIDPGSQQSKGNDHRQIDAVLYGHKLGIIGGVQFSYCGGISRIDLYDSGIFHDDLGGKIAEFIDLVGEGIPFLFRGENPDYLRAAEFVAVYLDGFGVSATIFERIPISPLPKPGDSSVSSPFFFDYFDERLCHRYFVDGIFRKTDPKSYPPPPSASNEPIPIALLMRPSSPSPASVTPRWIG